MKKMICRLGAVALAVCSVLLAGGAVSAPAEASTGEVYQLYSGGGEEEVTFSRPEMYASASAANAVDLLTTVNPDGTTTEGSTYFYERGLDCFILRGYTGYLYGAVNLTFADPIPDVSRVKSMTLTLQANIYHGYDYEDIIYFSEEGDSVTIPYFRLHAVDSDGSVNTDTFFSFNTNNVPRQGQRLEVTLSPRDVRKLANDEGALETLQWSVFTNRSTYYGFSYFYIYDISYELFAPEDYHSVTFYDGSVKLGDATTAYTVEPFEGISRTGYTPVWKDKPENGTVFDFSRPITEDTSLYLDWVKQTCTLTFDSTGGSSVAAITAEYGDAITEPEAPERAGYTFGGWYTDEACTQPYEFSTMGESRTVYAKWTRKTQTAADPEAGGCGRNGTGTALVGVIAALACVGIGRKGF